MRLRSKSTAKQIMKGEKQMVHLNIRIRQTLISAAMIALAVLTGYGLSQADNADVSMAVFFVG
jgi:hypothetical protein